MIRYLKHIVRIILIFALIMCWGISLGYANNIGSENKTAFDFVENSMLENKPFDKLAFFINRRIQQSMNVLFK